MTIGIIALICLGAIALGFLILMAAANTPTDSSAAAAPGIVLTLGGVAGLVVCGLIGLWGLFS